MMCFSWVEKSAALQKSPKKKFEPKINYLCLLQKKKENTHNWFGLCAVYTNTTPIVRSDRANAAFGITSRFSLYIIVYNLYIYVLYMQGSLHLRTLLRCIDNDQKIHTLSNDFDCKVKNKPNAHLFVFILFHFSISRTETQVRNISISWQCLDFWTWKKPFYD